MAYAKTSLRAEQRALRERMRDQGMSTGQIALGFAQHFGLRPRAAWRTAYGWSLTEAAEQINAYAAGSGLSNGGTVAMTAAHLCEHENWPGQGPVPTGRKPGPFLLSLLAAVYGCTIQDLLDTADYEHLPAADRLILDKADPGSGAAGPAIGTSASSGPVSLPRLKAEDSSPGISAGAGDAAEADARNVIAWAESTNISDDVVDYLARAAARAAEDHISLPPTVMLPRVQQLHAMVTTLLQGGRQRFGQTRQLLRLDAELLAHLCQLLGDVHRDKAAVACGRAAVILADEAGTSPAHAFSAQAQIARWRNRHADAADLAAEGIRRGAAPSLRVLLAYQEATSAAAAGKAQRAHAAIARAEAAEYDRPGQVSIWSCPPARQALYRLGVELSLGRPKETLRLAADAKALWHGELAHAYGTRGHIQIAIARAHLLLGSVEAASEHVTPVLSLSREYRLATLVEHIAVVDGLLGQQRFKGSAAAAALRAQVADFAHDAVPQQPGPEG
jgi:hypothetical protein